MTIQTATPNSAGLNALPASPPAALSSIPPASRTPADADVDSAEDGEPRAQWLQKLGLTPHMAEELEKAAKKKNPVLRRRIVENVAIAHQLSTLEAVLKGRDYSLQIAGDPSKPDLVRLAAIKCIHESAQAVIDLTKTAQETAALDGEGHHGGKSPQTQNNFFNGFPPVVTVPPPSRPVITIPENGGD